MRIFLSYASERRRDAEKLSLSLRQDGHDVFFDRSSLTESESYDNRIREKLHRSDLLVYLISPESVEGGSYALSELEVYRRRFPDPSGRVLPVLVAPTESDAIPGYLGAVTILQPVGNLVAEVTAKVSELARLRRRARRRLAAIGATLLAALAAAAAGAFFLVRPAPPPEPNRVRTFRSFSMFAEPNQDSRITNVVKEGTEFTLMPKGGNENWVRARLDDGAEGWVMAQDLSVVESTVKKIDVAQGFGFRGAYWQLYFTSPRPQGERRNEYGIDARLVDAINRCQKTLDIEASSLNSRMITDAIIDAHRRNVAVRVVTDAKKLDGGTFGELVQNGIPVKTGGARGKLVLSQFSILDNKAVWTGSWTYTDKGTYENNDNSLVLESPEIVAVYAARFNLMYEGGQAPPDAGGEGGLEQQRRRLPQGVNIYFSPEDDVQQAVRSVLSSAKSSIRFMTQGFDHESIAGALEEKARGGVQVQGVIEAGFQRSASGWRLLLSDASKLDVRVDGNPNILHHNCIVIDDKVVLTGSIRLNRSMKFDFGDMAVISDGNLAAKYGAEFQRVWGTAADVRALARACLGRYEPKPGSSLSVTAEEGALVLEGAGQPRVRLEPKSIGSAFEFACKDADAKVTFYKGEGGKVTHLILERGDQPEVRADKVE